MKSCENMKEKKIDKEAEKKNQTQLKSSRLNLNVYDENKNLRQSSETKISKRRSAQHQRSFVDVAHLTRGGRCHSWEGYRS